MLTHIAIGIVAGILGYLFGLLSPCCRSRKPLGRWDGNFMTDEEIENYNEAVNRVASEKPVLPEGQGCIAGCESGRWKLRGEVSPVANKTIGEALEGYRQRREGQCGGSGCKSGKCSIKGPSPLTSYLKSKLDPEGCNCWSCLDTREGIISWFPVCSKCGNKRCPHQADHRFKCTGSNEPGQVGELEGDAWSSVTPSDILDDLRDARDWLMAVESPEAYSRRLDEWRVGKVEWANSLGEPLKTHALEALRNLGFSTEMAQASGSQPPIAVDQKADPVFTLPTD